MMTWNQKCELEDAIDEAYFNSPEWAKLMEAVEYSLEYPTIEISPSHTIHFVSEEEWKQAARMPNFWDTRP